VITDVAGEFDDTVLAKLRELDATIAVRAVG